MSKDSVLILGAGLMQKPAILSAKKLGFNTVVVDANPDAECVGLADSFKKIDLKDREGIYNFALELKNTSELKGIFTAGTDFSASVSYAAEKLNFPCHSYEAALNATIKPRMRQCFLNAGVPSPAFFSLSGEEITESRVLEIVNKLGFPCVVKPADNMGARGCRMVRNENEAWSSVKAAAENSRSATVILEEYMEGPEYSIDALVYDGTMTITGFADRHIFYPPYFIETGHTMPAIIEQHKRLELISAFAKGVAALGLSCGAAKADIKFTSKGPQIGEIAARLSGGYMSGWTFPLSSDLNLTQQALLIATGNDPFELSRGRQPLNIKNDTFVLYNYPSKKVSAERAWISIPGLIKSVSGMEKGGEAEIQEIFPRPVKPGDEVDFPRNNVQKCGNVISLSAFHKEACEAAEEKAGNVLVRLEPCNDKTEAFLSAECLSDEKGFPPSAFSSFEKVCALELEGIIETDSSVISDAEKYPELKKLLDLPETDWTHKTAYAVAECFDSLCPSHPAISRKRFWCALFRGGLQAAIYVSDSVLYSEK